MDKKRLFPSGIAINKAFCNRVEERGYLKKCVENNEHIVLISPRRYGKTSLITQVILDCKLPSTSIDLLLAPDAEYVKDAILNGVGALCSELLPEDETLKQKFISIFADFNPKVVLTAFGQKLELSSPLVSVKTITDALMSLDVAAKVSNKKVIFALDEFQQVATLNQNHTIEASIRHAVERSEQVAYIFSGSNRHMLEQMFNDKSRPLYHLCELMKLDRISSTELEKFINFAAQEKWQQMLDEDAIHEIINLTQCHTFYVNRICRMLWKMDDIPNKDIIRSSWNAYIDNQKWITDDLAMLTPNQRKVMTVLSFSSVKQIFSSQMISKMNLTSSSISKAVGTLENLDLIYKNPNGEYDVLDPAIKSFIRRYRTN